RSVLTIAPHSLRLPSRPASAPRIAPRIRACHYADKACSGEDGDHCRFVMEEGHGPRGCLRAGDDRVAPGEAQRLRRRRDSPLWVIGSARGGAKRFGLDSQLRLAFALSNVRPQRERVISISAMCPIEEKGAPRALRRVPRP